MKKVISLLLICALLVLSLCSCYSSKSSRKSKKLSSFFNDGIYENNNETNNYYENNYYENNENNYDNEYNENYDSDVDVDVDYDYDYDSGYDSGSSASVNTNFSSLNSFSAQTLYDETFTQDDFRGYDVTVVNIWATFCGPCRSEMPDLARFEKSLPGNVQLITICTDASSGYRSDAIDILDDAGYTGITLISGSGDYSSLLYDIEYVPTTLFFDSQGNCVGSELIGTQSNLESAYTSHINSILAEMGKSGI